MDRGGGGGGGGVYAYLCVWCVALTNHQRAIWSCRAGYDIICEVRVSSELSVFDTNLTFDDDEMTLKATYCQGFAVRQYVTRRKMQKPSAHRTTYSHNRLASSPLRLASSSSATATSTATTTRLPSVATPTPERLPTSSFSSRKAPQTRDSSSSSSDTVPSNLVLPASAKSGAKKPRPLDRTTPYRGEKDDPFRDIFFTKLTLDPRGGSRCCRWSPRLLPRRGQGASVLRVVRLCSEGVMT